MPTTPLDSPPRPRFLADIALAAIVLLFLGLPSLALASTAWDDAFLLLPIQRAFAGPAAEQALVTGRIVVSVAAAVGMPTALVWRATNPTSSTIAVGALALAHFLTGAVLLPVDLVIFISLYSLTVHGTSQAQRVGLAAACGGALLIAASFTFDLAGLNIVVVGGMVTALGLTLVLLSWGAGLLRRARKDQRESLRQRALRAERERDQQAYLATIAERNRIAREMHDVVAHSLSVIVAQADGGRYAASTDPDSAREALETISETSRSALADIRGILGVLRDDQQPSTSLIPQPGETDLAALLTQVRKTGLDIHHDVTGSPTALPPLLGTTVYRVVQESLTNVLKHAGPDARVQVRTVWEPSRLTITVDDDGVARPEHRLGDGQGVVGMRERALSVGGELDAGAKPGGGFQVRLRIPVPDHSQQS